MFFFLGKEKRNRSSFLQFQKVFLCVTTSSGSAVRVAEILDDLHLLFAPSPDAATSAAQRRRELGLKMQGRERAMVGLVLWGCGSCGWVSGNVCEVSKNGWKKHGKRTAMGMNFPF